MNVIVDVDREQAILAGHGVYGAMVVELDPAALSAEERAALAAAPERSEGTDLTAATWGHHARAPQRPRTATPDPLAWLAWRREAQAFDRAYRAEEEARVERELAVYLEWARVQPVEAFLEWGGDGSRERVRWPLPRDGAPPFPGRLSWLDWERAPERRAREALAETWAAAEALAATRYAERQARRAAEETAREAERAAARQRRQDQLAAWVRAMDDNAQGRYALGVLDEAEILDAIIEQVFAPLERFPRALPLQVEDLEHEDTCEEPELECELGPASALGVPLTAEQYAAFALIATAAWGLEGVARPGETAQAVEVAAYALVCTCNDCDATRRRVYARVRVQLGELSLVRAYALTDDEPEAEMELEAAGSGIAHVPEWAK